MSDFRSRGVLSSVSAEDGSLDLWLRIRDRREMLAGNGNNTVVNLSFYMD